MRSVSISESRLHFLFVTIDPFPHTGGKSTHIATLTAGLKSLGHYTEVVSPSQLSRLETLVVRATGVACLPLGRTNSFWLRTLLRQHRLRRMVERRLAGSSFDAVIIEDAGAFPVVSGLAGLPLLIHTVHGDWTNERVSAGVCRRESFFGRHLLAQEKASYRGVNHIVTVDSRLYHHVQHLVVDPAAAEIMPNFVDLADFPRRDAASRAHAREKLGLSGEEFLVLCPRRLTPKNGVRFAILATALLRRNQELPIRMLLAGDGPQMQELRRLVDLEGLGDQVVFLGDVPNAQMPDLLAAADAVVIPSVPSEGVIEATSIAALEAMARGVPVVASAIGGLAELIESETTGLLVPPGDAEALAKAIARIAHEPRLAEAFTNSARTQIETQHSHLVAAQRYVAIVEAGMLR